MLWHAHGRRMCCILGHFKPPKLCCARDMRLPLPLCGCDAEAAARVYAGELATRTCGTSLAR